MKKNNRILLIILIGIITITQSCKTLKGNKTLDYSDVLLFQNGKETLLSKDDNINIKKDGFSLRFYSKKYNSETKKFYAIKVAAFLEAKDLDKVNIGMLIEDTPNFKPGSGLAAHESGKYESFFLNNYGSHYLIYEDEDSKRLNLLKSVGEYNKLEFEINTFTSNGKTFPIQNTEFSKFYLIILNDQNLNGIIDQNELTKMTIHIK